MINPCSNVKNVLVVRRMHSTVHALTPMEQKLFELSKKFDTMNQKQSPGGGGLKESQSRDREGSRVMELEAELKQERARIAELEEQLKDYELEKAENAKQLSKSMDKIYDLEQDIDQGRD